MIATTTLDVSFRLRLLTVNLLALAAIRTSVARRVVGAAGACRNALVGDVDIAGALAVFVRGEGFVVIRSRT
jgi:hypothetical protein